MKVKQIRKSKTKEQKEKERLQKKIRYHSTLKFDPKYKSKVAFSTRRWQACNPEKYLLASIKSRAKRRGIPFNLELSDIVLPDVCPILGIKLINRATIGLKNSKGNSASVDRIIPTLGYVKGNIQIISARANQMKTDATPKELITFSNWILKQYKISPGVS